MQPARSTLTFLLASSLLACAQTSKPTPARKPQAAPLPTTQLPVTRVALYKNGVGFFEHAGHVTGSQSVTIDFTTAQLNDVLQSLTAIDLNGGRIAGADYNSTTPLDQQLRSLPLGLSQNPSTADFYNAIRGARVEVHAGSTTITGRLLNIEVSRIPAAQNQPATERRLITVISDTGEVRTIDITPALTSTTTVRLLDTDLHTDVTRYLQLLASTRNQGLRHLTLQDNAPAGATGPRELHVSYISEVPIWKSTYRILFTDPSPAPRPASGANAPSSVETATLQGWSVVDNTTGEDWLNIHLSLIAGAPQSFIQPLSQPIYSRRREIPIAQNAQLTPQTHESGEMKQVTAGSSNQTVIVTDAPPSLNTVNATLGGTIEDELYTNMPLSMGGSRAVRPLPQGVYGGTGQTNLNNNYIEGIPGDSFQIDASRSITPNSTTATFDDYFAYNLTDPITIRKNESALVPILQTKIDAERVTLASWNGTSTSQPLRALWITNTSNLTLDRGSFSIVEDGNFGGEGLLDPIHPAEKRLLSYAADQAIHIAVDANTFGNRITGISAAKGVLQIRRTDTHDLTFSIRNAAPAARTIVLEVPVAGGFKIDSTPAPAETTPTVYRFRVNAASGETATLHIGGKRPTTTTYQLTNSDTNQLTFILNSTDHNPALEAALQPILAARRRVADAQSTLDTVNARLTGLRSDEERQRANVTALATADKASRQRFVHDLNATEDQITTTQKDLTAADSTLQAAKDDLATKIETLQINETI